MFFKSKKVNKKKCLDKTLSLIEELDRYVNIFEKYKNPKRQLSSEHQRLRTPYRKIKKQVSEQCSDIIFSALKAIKAEFEEQSVKRNKEGANYIDIVKDFLKYIGEITRMLLVNMNDQAGALQEEKNNSNIKKGTSVKKNISKTIKKANNILTNIKSLLKGNIERVLAKHMLDTIEGCLANVNNQKLNKTTNVEEKLNKQSVSLLNNSD